MTTKQDQNPTGFYPQQPGNFINDQVATGFYPQQPGVFMNNQVKTPSEKIEPAVKTAGNKPAAKRAKKDGTK